MVQQQTRIAVDKAEEKQTDRGVKSIVKRLKKSIMAEQNGRNKTAATSPETAVTTAPGVREFVEGWTLAQTLGEGAYGE